MGAAVLIVDDDDGIRESLRMVLEEEGYTVFEATDGKSALVRLCDDPQRMVVLLDVQMPGIDGVGLMRIIAAQASLAERHAYIVMTAHGGTLPPDVAPLFTRLDAPVFAKPFDVQPFLAAIATAAQHLARVAS